MVVSPTYCDRHDTPGALIQFSRPLPRAEAYCVSGERRKTVVTYPNEGRHEMRTIRRLLRRFATNWDPFNPPPRHRV